MTWAALHRARSATSCLSCSVFCTAACPSAVFFASKSAFSLARSWATLEFAVSLRLSRTLAIHSGVIFEIHRTFARASIFPACACFNASLRGCIFSANCHEYTRHINWPILLLIAVSISPCRDLSIAAFILRSASGRVETSMTFKTDWGLLAESSIRSPLSLVSGSIWRGQSSCFSAILLKINRLVLKYYIHNKEEIFSSLLFLCWFPCSCCSERRVSLWESAFFHL